MPVVTRSGVRSVANRCEFCNVKEKMAGENRCEVCMEKEKMGVENRFRVCLEKENMTVEAAEDKTIYIQLMRTHSLEDGTIWYAIEEKSDEINYEIKKKNKKKDQRVKHMEMGGNWRITKLGLPQLPSGYDDSVCRISALPFKSRIYLFGGFKRSRIVGGSNGVPDVLSFDVRLLEWHSALPMKLNWPEPCAVALDDGSIVVLNYPWAESFTPDDNSSSDFGDWQSVPYGSIPGQKFSCIRLLAALEDNKKLLLYNYSRMYLIKYDLQNKSVEFLQENFGRWDGGGAVLFDHYLFCFGTPDYYFEKPRSLYAFNLRDLKWHSKVRNLPTPDDRGFPEEDFNPDQLVCLLKINDCNDKLALIWNTMEDFPDYLHRTLLRCVKFNIVKSKTGKFFEARILSKGGCIVDGRHPINCVAMPIGQEGKGRPIGQEGKSNKKRKRN